MITAIQSFVQKNASWVFSILLVVILVTFVFYVGNSPQSLRGSDKIEFFGMDLRNRNQTENLSLATQQSARISGQYIMSEQHLNQLAETRAMLLYFADEYNIPNPTEEQLAEHIQTLPAFQTPEGNFSSTLWTEFLDEIESNQRTSQESLSEVLNDDIRIKWAKTLLDNPGYELPYEALQNTVREQTIYSFDLAKLTYESFKPEIEADDAALALYYEENSGNYAVPERVETSYALFKAENFMDKVELPENEAVLEQFFQQNRRNYPNADALTSVKSVVEQDYLKQLATQEAIAHANSNFALVLHRQQIENGSDAFNKLVKDADAEIIEQAPYSEEGLLTGSPLPRNTLSEAFRLNRYYGDPVATENGAAVLLINGKIERYIPELDVVKEEVIADWKEAQREEAFAKKGEELKIALEAHNTAEAFALEAEKLGLEVEAVRNYKVSEPKNVIPFEVRSKLATFELGAISDMVSTGNDGTFVLMVEKEEPDLTVNDTSVKQSMESNAMMVSLYLSQSIQSELIYRERIRSGMVVEEEETESN